MSPAMLRGLAIGLVGLAVVLGFLGWRLGQTDDPVAFSQDVERSAAPAASGYPAVVATRSLTPGFVVGMDDADEAAFKVARLPVAVEGGFKTLDELHGRRLTRSLAPGDVVRSGSFAAGSMLAEVVPEGKRALAISVDEVIGSGGFIAPGDRVDVLFEAQSHDRSRFSRLLFRSLPVMSYGNALEGAGLVADSHAETGKRSGRTAVLAVAAEDVPALLLAEQSGRLRLAVVGTAEQARDVELVEPERPQQAALSLGPALLFQDLSEMPRAAEEAEASRTVQQFVGSERHEAMLH